VTSKTTNSLVLACHLSHVTRHCSYAASTESRSIDNPGPMVDEITMLLTYLPLAEAGLALMTLEIRAPGVFRQLLRLKRDLAHGAMDDSRLVDAETPLFRLLLLSQRVPRQTVTVPVWGWASDLSGPIPYPAYQQTSFISGVATTASKSTHPPWILTTRSSPPDSSAPASRPSRTLSPEAITMTPLGLSQPVGQKLPFPRTICQRAWDQTPKRMATSTVSSNLANAAFFDDGHGIRQLVDRLVNQFGGA